MSNSIRKNSILTPATIAAYDAAFLRSSQRAAEDALAAIQADCVSEGKPVYGVATPEELRELWDDLVSADLEVELDAC